MSDTLSQTLAVHGLSESNLTRTVSKAHRQEFIKKIVDWKVVGAALGFAEEELDIIDDGYENDEQKKTNLFIQWSVRHREEATYLKLAQLLFNGGLRDLLESLCAILKSDKPPFTSTMTSGLSM